MLQTRDLAHSIVRDGEDGAIRGYKSVLNLGSMICRPEGVLSGSEEEQRLAEAQNGQGIWRRIYGRLYSELATLQQSANMAEQRASSWAPGEDRVESDRAALEGLVKEVRQSAEKMWRETRPKELFEVAGQLPMQGSETPCESGGPVAETLLERTERRIEALERKIGDQEEELEALRSGDVALIQDVYSQERQRRIVLETAVRMMAEGLPGDVPPKNFALLALLEARLLRPEERVAVLANAMKTGEEERGLMPLRAYADKVFSAYRAEVAASVQAADGMTQTLREIAGGAENPAKMAYLTLSFLGMIDPEELSDIAETLRDDQEPEILEAAGEAAADVQELRVLAESLVAGSAAASLAKCPFCGSDRTPDTEPGTMSFGCGSERLETGRWQVGKDCVRAAQFTEPDPSDFADAEWMEKTEEWEFQRQLPEFLDEMAAGAQRIREAQRAFREGESWVGPICDATAAMVEFCRVVLPKWQGLDRFVRQRIDSVPDGRGAAEFDGWTVKNQFGHICGFCGFPLPGNGAVAPPPAADQGPALEPDLGKLASLVGSLEGLYREYVGAKFSGRTSVMAETGEELLGAVVGHWFEIRAALLDAGDGGRAEALAELAELLDIEEQQSLAVRMRARTQLLLTERGAMRLKVQRGLPSGRAYIVANDLRSGLVSSGMVREHDEDGQFSVELAILCHVGQLLRWRRQGHRPIRRA